MHARKWLTLAFAVTLVSSFAGTARAQWTITAPDGNSSLTLGVLAQSQYEALKPVSTDAFVQNLFVRRARVIGGGRLNAATTFFFDTDVPNIGKGQTTGKKVDNTLVLQDFAFTHAFCPDFKLDAGMLLVPLSHNSQQSAASLLPVDYGPYGFLSSDSVNAKVGRDYGVQARGWLGDRALELRAGLFQGNRGTDGRGPFRFAARAVWYPFDADTGMFYTGTTLGKRKIVALGASYDVQRDYMTYSGDAFVDWPLDGDAITLQGAFMRYDGGNTFAGLPRQGCILAEAGYYLHALKVTPFVQYAKRDYADDRKPSDSKLQVGVAIWGQGHKDNLKLGFARLLKDKESAGTQIVAQWQVMSF